MTPFARNRRILILLAIAVVVVTGVGLSVGQGPISLMDTLAILGRPFAVFAQTETDPSDDWKRIILIHVRMPRVFAGLLIGGAFAVSGAVLQGLFRNPMAEPGLLGVTGGASLGAVIAIFFNFAAVSLMAIPAAAFVGALSCAGLVYVIALRTGRASVATLLLAGIAVGGLATALTSFLLSISFQQYDIARQIIFWLMGGLDGRSWQHLQVAAPMILLGSVMLFLHGEELNLLSLGEDSALSLGLDVPVVRRRLLVLSSGVTAAAVAVSGSIGFVGLVVPHMARLVVGPDHRWLLPVSFLGGGALVVLVDIVARMALAPREIPMGVLTSLLGGPFFLYLLVAYRNQVQET